MKFFVCIIALMVVTNVVVANEGKPSYSKFNPYEGTVVIVQLKKEQAPASVEICADYEHKLTAIADGHELVIPTNSCLVVGGHRIVMKRVYSKEGLNNRFPRFRYLD